MSNTTHGESIEVNALDSVPTIVFLNIARNDTVVWVAADAEAYHRALEKLSNDSNIKIIQNGLSHVAR